MTDPHPGESIAEAQARLAGEFQLFDDWMDRYQMLIDMGKALDVLPEGERSDALKVPGCQSQVWLKSEFDGARLTFTALSEGQTWAEQEMPLTRRADVVAAPN